MTWHSASLTRKPFSVCHSILFRYHSFYLFVSSHCPTSYRIVLANFNYRQTSPNHFHISGWLPWCLHISGWLPWCFWLLLWWCLLPSSFRRHLFLARIFHISIVKSHDTKVLQEYYAVLSVFQGDIWVECFSYTRWPSVLLLLLLSLQSRTAFASIFSILLSWYLKLGNLTNFKMVIPTYVLVDLLVNSLSSRHWILCRRFVQVPSRSPN